MQLKDTHGQTPMRHFWRGSYRARSKRPSQRCRKPSGWP
jgi:hypothetical protein